MQVVCFNSVCLWDTDCADHNKPFFLHLFGSTEDYEPDYFPGRAFLGSQKSFMFSKLHSRLNIRACIWFFFLDPAENENPDPLPGTYQQQVQIQPAVRPGKSGLLDSHWSHISFMWLKYVCVNNIFGNLFSMWILEPELETEPTEPGPLGENAAEMSKGNCSL